MSTKHIKTKWSLFNFEGPTENTVASVPIKDKEKKNESIPFYIKALDRLNTNLNLEATETNVVVNTGIGNIVDVEATFDREKSTYGNYKSIWQKPKIRQNMDFEEEIDPDEEFYFDDEELNCDIKAPFCRQEQQDTQPSLIPEETPEESLENTPAVPEEEPKWERTYVNGPSSGCVSVVGELQDTIGKVSKKPSMVNIEPLTTKKATEI